MAVAFHCFLNIGYVVRLIKHNGRGSTLCQTPQGWLPEHIFFSALTVDSGSLTFYELLRFFTYFELIQTSSNYWLAPISIITATHTNSESLLDCWLQNSVLRLPWPTHSFSLEQGLLSSVSILATHFLVPFETHKLYCRLHHIFELHVDCYTLPVPFCPMDYNGPYRTFVFDTAYLTPSFELFLLWYRFSTPNDVVRRYDHSNHDSCSVSL